MKKQCTDEIVSQWILEMEVLRQIAKIELKAAYCCFTTGFEQKVSDLMSTTSNINEELRRLDDLINNKLIPFFTDNKICGNDERSLLSPPAKLGGMRISVFSQSHRKRTCH